MPDSTPTWLKVSDALKAAPGTAATVKGWVRTRRDSKAGLSFVALSDGTCFDALQIVAPAALPNYESEVLHLTTGCAIEASGTLVQSQGKGQGMELQADSLTLHGLVEDPDTYPASAKRHTFEYLREHQHLRVRTNTFGAVARVRHALAMAVHRFFDDRSFFYVHTPIITASDCEGAGQMFRVSTLDMMNLPRAKSDGVTKGRSDEGKAADAGAPRTADPADLRSHENLMGSGSAPFPSPSTRHAHDATEASDPSSPPSSLRRSAAPSLPVDFSHDFFGKEAHLTVSGQLNVETYCCALSRVYTFGPTFRAENSNTSRHLSEFWMIEPEVAFADLAANAQLAEDMLKFLFDDLLSRRADDMAFFDERIEKGIIDRLRFVIDKPFRRLPYTEAIDILLKSGKKFEYPVAWGSDLQSEHERYLTEEHFKQPVVLTNYPKGIKAFYMRLDDESPERTPGINPAIFDKVPPEQRHTVSAMDVLVPGIGEIIGGSQREERLERLDRRIDEMGLHKPDYWWYRDLRRYGTVPHAGFGLGFERLIMFCTGMQNIRDVIPFPRAPKLAEF